MRAQAADKETRIRHEFSVLWPDGSRHRLATGVRCIHEGGRPRRMVGAVMDVALRHETMQLAVQRGELASENQRLQDLALQRTRLLANMWHEPRTPLNAVLGFAQLQRADPAVQASARPRSQLDHIADAGQHLLRLTGDVLDIGRIAGGGS